MSAVVNFAASLVSLQAEDVRFSPSALINAVEGAMRAVVFTVGREIEFMDFPDPTPGPGEVVVEMKVPALTLVPLPAELSFTAGAVVSCGHRV